MSYKTLTLEQVCYDPDLDQAVSLEKGLNYWTKLEDMDLVATLPSQGYAPGCTTIFVFLKRDRQ